MNVGDFRAAVEAIAAADADHEAALKELGVDPNRSVEPRAGAADLRNSKPARGSCPRP